MIDKTSNLKNNILVIAMIASGSFFVLQVGGYAAFLWLQVLFVIVSAAQTKKFYFSTGSILNVIYLSMFVSAISAAFTNMPYSYKKTAIVLPIMSIPLYLAAMYIRNLIKKQNEWIMVIKKGIKIAVAVQMIWIPIQMICYYLLDVDINKLIFVDTLHCVENASFVRSWIWYPSGLSWHSATLAPLFVMGYILYNNLYIRLAILVEAMVIGNSTSLIGVLLCAFLMMLYDVRRKDDNNNLSKRKILSIIILFIIAVIAVIKLDLISVVINSIDNVWIRIFGENRDESTSAHFGYYADYLKIAKNSSLIQVIFGYGYGCSGYGISVMYNRYTDLGNWSVESDIVDILLSRGIFGATIFYSFVFFVMFKGLKIDKRYFIFMFVIFVQGFGYNVQFDYLFLLEMILYFTIKQNVNFFDCKTSVSE